MRRNNLEKGVGVQKQKRKWNIRGGSNFTVIDDEIVSGTGTENESARNKENVVLQKESKAGQEKELGSCTDEKEGGSREKQKVL